MSLAFNIKNAGPLAQVGLEIISLNTAVHLATGAYGWFKSYERSESLIKLLSVGGGELVACSSFNFSAYRDLRTQHGTMKGVVVQKRTVLSTSLPKASTAIPDHPGTACLRALTAGILCLYDTDATVGILQNLIPYALIQLHQEDAVLEIEGPLLSSLKQWVSSVALEEDSNTFRDFILLHATSQESSLTGVPVDEIMNLDWTRTDEIPYVIGVLRWILTPTYRRDPKQYPTRSLRVWTVAVVMAKMGFDVYAAPAVVRNVDDYDCLMDASRRFGGSPDVFLVVTNGGETDPMQLNEVPIMGDDSLRPQVTVVRGIPWLAFRHLRGKASAMNTEYLVDVWNYSFRNARSCFRGIKVERFEVKVLIQESEVYGVSELHKSLLSQFSPHLIRICGPVMQHFVPISPRNISWDPTNIMERMCILRSEDELFEKDDEVGANCYVLIAILLGTIYGLCSRAIIDDGVLMSEDSELLFLPDAIYSGGVQRLKNWSRAVGTSLTSLGCDKWTDLMFELFLAAVNTRTNPTTTSTNHGDPQGPVAKRLLLGAQANGMTAISDLIVQLTIRHESLGYWHIKRGQILTLPLTEDGYIEASTYVEMPLQLTMNPEPENCVLKRFDSYDCEDSMRIDVEPCWEADPRTIIFRVRHMGVTIAPINISLVVEVMAYDTIRCLCRNPVNEVPVPPAERWQHVTIRQLMRTMFKGMSVRRADVNQADGKVLIDASRSEAATIYAIGITYAGHLYVATSCLECAYKAAMQAPRPAGTSAVVVIPWS
ncbi:hypothetical protein K432DRAFT_410152 [Lepidopterella palustris CBS 459.81]|uniref:Uncharacterized protein n=1 Tax=Lepidopterella palustris CBS 459.81 TaxID=1314670 RepID=A0A8E2DYH5_9PEZI|nr:hypothetical protein K432DRAFT_410152 [Lepidopterella palustris CBS 459.81]